MILLTGAAQSIYENPIQNGDWSEKYSFTFNVFFALLIPMLLLATAWIKRAFSRRAERRGR
jgi:spore germination protein KB